MQLYIASALAFIAGAAIAAAWPTARQRIAYWTGYAVGRLKKLASKPVWTGVDQANVPTIMEVPTVGNRVVLNARSAGKTAAINESLSRRFRGAQ